VSCQFVKIHFQPVYLRSGGYDRDYQKPYQASGIIKASVGFLLLTLTNVARYRPEVRYKLKK
jgi:hypothetical protein